MLADKADAGRDQGGGEYAVPAAQTQRGRVSGGAGGGQEAQSIAVQAAGQGGACDPRPETFPNSGQVIPAGAGVVSHLHARCRPHSQFANSTTAEAVMMKRVYCLISDAEGMPLAVLLTAANSNDVSELMPIPIIKN